MDVSVKNCVVPLQITASKYESGKYKTVSQIDLVPTISLLLGAPVPYSNLGTVITGEKMLSLFRFAYVLDLFLGKFLLSVTINLRYCFYWSFVSHV